MFYLIKTITVSATHQLVGSYNEHCGRQHGHNWRITLHLKTTIPNDYGMVVDFNQIKETIMQKMDHQNLNEVFKFNPTAENIAFWVVDTIKECYKCEVEETPGNIAIYEYDGNQVHDLYKKNWTPEIRTTDNKNVWKSNERIDNATL